MTKRVKTFENDIREKPAYGLAEAARFLDLPIATLRSWVLGRPYPKLDGQGVSQPIIHPSKSHPVLLSFWNLVEAHVLRSLRTRHGVSIKAVREALRYAERHEQIERLLLSKGLLTDAGRLFLEKYGELIDLSASGQIAIRHVFDEHLKRVEWDNWQFPVRLYPFVSHDAAIKSIAIDPNIAFGRPILLSKGISTSIIAERIDSGESVADVADDYDLRNEDIEQALLYERAA